MHSLPDEMGIEILTYIENLAGRTIKIV